ncbi:uncharacterized protein LOC134798574 [Cydia splendana]|uniref:uncharacterized protein LOC134798574 n=1 Tax=Cydia splendana TaxID=1100963 RepID=UPI00214635E3
MSKLDFRDVSWLLRKFRQFLLGRKHDIPNLHVRFPPRISPRSIPTPSIPRGPEYINKYYDQWYMDRCAKDGVKPPIVGPLGEGPSYPLDCTKTPRITTVKPTEVNFACPPTPGTPWWWDGHCYYECTPEKPPKKAVKCNPPPDECPKTPKC